MKARVDSYKPYSINEVGGGYYSFHLFANPRPVETERDGETITEHEVDLYKTSMSLFGSLELATDYVEENWQLLVDECRKQEEVSLANSVRAERNRLLDKADIAVNKAVDIGNAEEETRARAWRQALRDIPEQAGFPWEVEWPTLGGV